MLARPTITAPLIRTRQLGAVLTLWMLPPAPPPTRLMEVLKRRPFRQVSPPPPRPLTPTRLARATSLATEPLSSPHHPRHPPPVRVRSLRPYPSLVPGLSWFLAPVPPFSLPSLPSCNTYYWPKVVYLILRGCGLIFCNCPHILQLAINYDSMGRMGAKATAAEPLLAFVYFYVRSSCFMQATIWRLKF